MVSSSPSRCTRPPIERGSSASSSPSSRRSAWVAIVEWQKGQAAVGPPDEERIAEAEVMALAKTVGLRISGRRTLTSNYYLVLLRK